MNRLLNISLIPSSLIPRICVHLRSVHSRPQRLQTQLQRFPTSRRYSLLYDNKKRHISQYSHLQYQRMSQRLSLSTHPSFSPFNINPFPPRFSSRRPITTFTSKSTVTSKSSLQSQNLQSPAPPRKKKKSVRRAGAGLSDDLESGQSLGLVIQPERVDDIVTAPKAMPFRCVAYCTAEDYKFDILEPLLQKNYIINPYITDDVFHVQIQPSSTFSPTSQSSSTDSESSPDANDSPYATELGDPLGEFFVFRGGCFVAWGTTEAENEKFLNDIIKAPGAEVGTYDKYETEEMDWVVNYNEQTTLQNDTIIIGPSPPAPLSKLAFSHGLARSAKLGILEVLLDNYLNSTRYIPHVLSTGRAVPLTRREVMRKLGDLMILRAMLNLNSSSAESLLDTPDYYWSKPQLEEYYNRITRCLDVKPRIAVLNQKLDYASELAALLRGHLGENHSLKLEWFIIILIAVEVGFEIVHWSEKMGWIGFANAGSSMTENRLNSSPNENISVIEQERGRQD